MISWGVQQDAAANDGTVTALGVAAVKLPQAVVIAVAQHVIITSTSGRSNSTEKKDDVMSQGGF